MLYVISLPTNHSHLEADYKAGHVHPWCVFVVCPHNSAVVVPVDEVNTAALVVNAVMLYAKALPSTTFRRNLATVVINTSGQSDILCMPWYYVMCNHRVINRHICILSHSQYLILRQNHFWDSYYNVYFLLNLKLTFHLIKQSYRSHFEHCSEWTPMSASALILKITKLPILHFSINNTT